MLPLSFIFNSTKEVGRGLWFGRSVSACLLYCTSASRHFIKYSQENFICVVKMDGSPLRDALMSLSFFYLASNSLTKLNILESIIAMHPTAKEILTSKVMSSVNRLRYSDTLCAGNQGEGAGAYSSGVKKCSTVSAVISAMIIGTSHVKCSNKALILILDCNYTIHIPTQSHYINIKLFRALLVPALMYGFQFAIFSYPSRPLTFPLP